MRRQQSKLCLTDWKTKVGNCSSMKSTLNCGETRWFMKLVGAMQQGLTVALVPYGKGEAYSMLSSRFEIADDDKK